jgi:hypothetical protein
VTGPLFARHGIRVALGVPALLSIAVLPLYLGTAPALVPLGALLIGALGPGTCGVTPLLLARLFPAEVRGRAVGLVYHVGGLTAAAVPPLVAWLAESGTGLTLSESIALVVVAVQALTAALLFLGPLPEAARARRPDAAWAAA